MLFLKNWEKYEEKGAAGGVFRGVFIVFQNNVGICTPPKFRRNLMRACTIHFCVVIIKIWAYQKQPQSIVTYQRCRCLVGSVKQPKLAGESWIFKGVTVQT